MAQNKFLDKRFRPQLNIEEKYIIFKTAKYINNKFLFFFIIYCIESVVWYQLFYKLIIFIAKKIYYHLKKLSII
jgi:hypothetical protein